MDSDAPEDAGPGGCAQMAWRLITRADLTAQKSHFQGIYLRE